jgi:hypothetical protein
MKKNQALRQAQGEARSKKPKSVQRSGREEYRNRAKVMAKMAGLFVTRYS